MPSALGKIQSGPTEGAHAETGKKARASQSRLLAQPRRPRPVTPTYVPKIHFPTEVPPELTPESIRQAVSAYFEQGLPSSEKHNQLTEAQYIHEGVPTTDLEEHAHHRNFHDALYIAKTIRLWHKETPKRGRTNNLFIVGAGPGRTIDIYIAMAKKVGIERIFVNDLIPAHIHLLREKLNKNHQEIESDSRPLLEGPVDIVDGIEIHYFPGDIGTVDVSQLKADLIFWVYYGASEPIDLQSAKATWTLRNGIYQNIASIMHPNSIYFEDMPSRKAGYYKHGTEITRAELEEQGINTDLAPHLLASNWAANGTQSNDWPFQMRLIPTEEDDVNEKKSAGLRRRLNDTKIIPIQASKALNLRLAQEKIHAAGDAEDAVEALRDAREDHAHGGFLAPDPSAYPFVQLHRISIFDNPR